MRYFSFLAAVLLPFLLLAQAPQAFDFQGVARDASGNVLSSQAIGLRISILTGSPTGDLAYQETHSVTTSPFGLFTIQVGNGTPTQSTFPSIGWGASSHFIQVELDASGGNDFQDMGTTQLLSVPYALHAKAVDCFSVSLLGDTLKQGNGCFVIIPGVSAANGGCLDQDGDGFYDRPGCGPVDCDDAQATVYPGAPEICGDGLDNDCDGGVDNAPDLAAYVPWYFDADEDGYGDAAVSQLACAQPTGYVGNDQDCDDSDAGRFPGQGCSLVCSLAEQAWIDQNMGSYLDQVFFIWANCFGSDPSCVEQQLIDLEQTGEVPLSLACHSCAIAYVECIQSNCLITCATAPLGIACQQCIAANCRAEFLNCAGLIDGDGDGWSTGSDCDDSDPTRFPGAPEACDGIDNNCDGQVDEGAVITWYPDIDGDGFGDDAGAVQACDAPGPEYITQGFDCDDADPAVFPYQGCPGFDCGFFYGTEQGTCGQGTFCDNGVCVPCQDLDDDGFFDCDGDCNDNDPDIFPGAVENCANGIDDNCDGQVDEECPCVEGTVEICGSNIGQCQQGTRTCLPGGVWGPCIGEVPPSPEICNGIDDDCDGAIDEDPVSGPIWYRDADGDGYGTANETIIACSVPFGYADNAIDCDDSDPDINPSAPEACNTIDDDCDGQVDEGFSLATDTQNCGACGIQCPSGTNCVNGVCMAVDLDEDGFGSDVDCNDTNADVNPGAVEVCDGIDNNCDGQVDEGFNLQTDTQNCGACGIQCPPGFSCVNGQCVE